MTDVAVHPEFAAHGSFEHLKLGRKPKVEDARTLRLAKYLDLAEALPATPPSADWVTGVPSWPMYGNDRLGDCTCAAVGHMIQAWSQAAGGLKTFADADIEALYIPDTGTQDDGRSEMDVLNYWRQTGVGQPSYADRIIAYASVDPSNIDEVKAAISFFGGLYVGIGLPLTAQGQSVWDVVSDLPGRNEPYSWGGHAVPILGYNQSGEYVVVTWGAPLTMTQAFWTMYGDEAYAIISPDFIGAAGVTPAGFDLERLEADLTEITQQ